MATMLMFGDAFETMGSTAFQGLVAALVTRAHPDARCFPLQGRDGGRDVVVPSFAAGSKQTHDTIVFQVKSRTPSPLGTPTEDELFRWLTAQLRREAPKIERLQERGISEYVLVTNIPGTGDLHKGLQDRLLDHLRDHVPVRARVWWREDIETRLRAYPDIAAGFGLVRGEAGLRALVGCRAEVHRGGLAVSSTPAVIQALLAFCRHQFDDEGKLRFRQVDLENLNLLDVYLDVSAVQRFHSFAFDATLVVDDEPDLDEDVEIDEDEFDEESDEQLEDIDDDRNDIVHHAYFRGGYGHAARFPVRASRLFLQRAERVGKHILLEGSPGQGKSTVTQYVCQVHRSRILDRQADIARIPQNLLFTPQRLPLRIELRRYATWRAQQADPEGAGILSYLCSLIQASSEIEVTTTDLVEVLTATPSFLALDGLDEVPDLDVREKVVQAIEKLAASLEAWDADVRILLTSRPSTMLRAPKVSDRTFDRFVLQDLHRSLITEYAETWMRLRRLPPDETETMRQVLAANLELSHIAELARNPMQLAILLWLINTRGWSLPDKRSALYDAYIETFLTRESEKSTVVRDNRELLLELHGYIAWLLHSKSERSGRAVNAGDIGREDLDSVIEDFLRSERRDPGIFRELFHGVQRVFVLVEREEGRFEFAVQPIREYFAARYLYSTSPQVPASADVGGSRPDRLEALIRRPYWSNVTRFFCGWYQKGELADLTRRLSDLATASDTSALLYPRQLIENILADFSVSASRRDTEALAHVLCDLTGLRMLADGGRSERRGNTLTLETGRLTLVERAEGYLEVSQPDEVLVELALLLQATGADLSGWWWDKAPQNPDSTNPAVCGAQKWLRIGILSGALKQLGSDQALQLFAPQGGDSLDWLRCIEAGRDDVLLHDAARFQFGLLTLSEGSLSLTGLGGGLRQTSSIANIAARLTPRYWLAAKMAFGRRRSSQEIAELYAKFPPLTRSVIEGLPKPLDALYRAVALPDPSSVVFSPWWMSAVSDAEGILGPGWAAWRIAICGANAARQRPTETASATEIFDRTVPLVDRAHRASLSYGIVARWSAWYRQAQDPSVSISDRMALVCISLLWADRQSLAQALPAANSWWDCFNERHLLEMEAFLGEVSPTSYIGRRKQALFSKEDSAWLKKLPASLLTLLITRYRMPPAWLHQVLSHQEVTEAERTIVSGRLLSMELPMTFRSGRESVPLENIRKHYATARHGVLRRHDAYVSGDYFVGEFALKIANQVSTDQDRYPWMLVLAASERLAEQAAKTLPTLGDVATLERWFVSD